MRRIRERRFAVDGTPTDCVLLAVNHLIEGAGPISCSPGINRGSNMGEDVTYSGTVAAAMEATLLGHPRHRPEPAARRAAHHLAPGAEAWRPRWSAGWSRSPWAEGVLMNVNFPYIAKGDITGMQVVRQGRRAANIEVAHAVGPTGRKFLWIGDFTSDNPVGAAAPTSARSGPGPSPSRRCIST